MLQIARILISGLVIVCSGCKLYVGAHNVGGVATSSGNYECHAGSACEFDVVDIFFEETFIGVSQHPNYRFKQWHTMKRGLCGGNSEPCSLWTSGFAGNKVLEAILESDEYFFLIPEFERIGSIEIAEIEYRPDGKPRVIDQEGQVIGSLELEGPFDEIKGINIHFKDLGDTYRLLVEDSATSGNFQITVKKNNFAYTGDSCQHQSIPKLIFAETGGSGSGGLAIPVTSLFLRSSSLLYIPDPTGAPVRATWDKTWDSTEQKCLNGPESEGLLFPLISTNVSLHYPLTVEGTDIIIESLW